MNKRQSSAHSRLSSAAPYGQGICTALCLILFLSLSFGVRAEEETPYLASRLETTPFSTIITRYRYDESGRLLREYREDGTLSGAVTLSHTYYPDGTEKCTELTGSSGPIRTLIYRQDGTLSSEENREYFGDALSMAEIILHDAHGNPTDHITFTGPEKEESFHSYYSNKYDGQGRLTNVYLYHRQIGKYPDETCSYSYSSDGRCTQRETVFGGNPENPQIWDEITRNLSSDGKPLSLHTTMLDSMPADIRVEFLYDEQGDLIRTERIETYPYGFAHYSTTVTEHTITRNDRGQILEIRSIETFQELEDGKILRETEKALPAEICSYDEQGNLLRHEKPDGTVITFTYAPLSELLLP